MQLQPSLCIQPDTVAVIAPGGGTGINGAVYAELGRDPRFHVDIVGQSRAPYDCYPETWPHGCPAPNLASFALDLVNQGLMEQADCLVLGSRGGQVVLPQFWQVRGSRVPPSVVINGGIAMGLPTPVAWPDSAVSFLLIGGDDYFRGNLSPAEYVADCKSHVPVGNSTTAILYVQEMQHMPQGKLLAAVLPHMLRVVLLWKADRTDTPLEGMRSILKALNSAGWSGRLSFTKALGVWEDIEFTPYQVSRLQDVCATGIVGHPLCGEAGQPIEHTRQDEMRELWRAATNAARPSGGAPLPPDGSRLAAVVKASSQQATAKSTLMLPIAIKRCGETMVIPSLQGGVGLSRSPVDSTPLSRALGITRPPYGSPVSMRSHGTSIFLEASPARFLMA